MRMSLSVCQVLESVENEEGRFRTLRDVVLVTDRSGRPVFTVSGRMISFPVSWQRCGYVLTCLLDRDHERFIRYSRIAEIIAQRSRKSTCLVDYRYLSQELLVFDDLGQSCYTDVVLMEMPRGAKRLDTVFDELCREDELLREFCRMAVWWIDSGLVHGSLAPKNIIQLSDGTLRLIHYERLQVLSKESENITAQHTDLVMLANMALALKAMIACPEIYRTLKGDPMFVPRSCRRFLKRRSVRVVCRCKRSSRRSTRVTKPSGIGTLCAGLCCSLWKTERSWMLVCCKGLDPNDGMFRPKYRNQYLRKVQPHE